MTDHRTALGRARGLGSAKEGVAHWWVQRVTALLLIPLVLWFVASLLAHLGADYAGVIAWLHEPLTFGLMVLLLGAMFWHAALGLQVVVEDYVHSAGMKLMSLLLLRFVHVLVGGLSIFAILRIAFGS